MTEPVTTETATRKSGVDVAGRLAAHPGAAPVPAQQARGGALALLVLLFIGCFALPPLLPWTYTDLDYTRCCSRRAPSTGSAPTRSARTSRADAARPAEVAAHRRLRRAHLHRSRRRGRGGRRLLRRLARPALMWVVDLLLVVPSFLLIAIVTPRLASPAASSG